MKKLLAAMFAIVMAGCISVSAFAEEAVSVELYATADEPVAADETPTGQEERKKGDINGDGTIDIEDAVSIINHINAYSALNDDSLAAADINGDEFVDIEDVVIILDEICGVDRTIVPAPEPPQQEEPQPEPPQTEPELPKEDPPKPEPVRSKKIDVKVTMQSPELPTGCEVTSLTIALNHAGYDVSKTTMANDFLPRMDFYWWNGVRYGADFTYVFAGNPNNGWSYGCLAPCIVEAGNRYLESVGSKQKMKNLTDTEFDDLLQDYIAKDKPVMVWITCCGLIAPRYTDSWYTPEGKLVTWLANEHCVVLTGFDLDKQEVYTADPMSGTVTYPMELFKQRYNEMGKNSVVIE